MRRLKTGLDSAPELNQVASSYVPLKQAMSEAQISKAWDRFAHEWADRYNEYGDLNRQHLIDPMILKLVGAVKDLHALDAGCGNGYLCRLLAKKGARVVGVDASKEFIKMARQKEKENPLGIEYYVGTICKMSMFQEETFDLEVSNLVLMDLYDLEKAIGELRRVLKTGGRLIFSIMHPCFASPPVHGWVRTPLDTNRNEDRIYWKVDRYFERTMEIWRLQDAAQPPLYSFHRPLSEYIKTLLKHGFMITGFEEPTPSKKAIEEHYRQFSEERIPWFLVMGAEKQ
jgi:2-polyprenyl-3-methyl-5-hydroxy-6-metoxy-1,4-benzoquinol methylase